MKLEKLEKAKRLILGIEFCEKKIQQLNDWQQANDPLDIFLLNNEPCQVISFMKGFDHSTFPFPPEDVMLDVKVLSEKMIVFYQNELKIFQTQMLEL